MPQFTVNPHRQDPYKNFKFRILWEGRAVAGVSRMSALKRSTEVITHREGGAPSAQRQMPGHTRFEPITLERGVTHDTAFEAWANQVWKLGLDPESALRSYRKDVTNQLLNENGTPVLVYVVYRCWVSEFVALPDLDANANAVAIESMKLVKEGWERDQAVTEPQESD
jgi:phage tail-like protein